VIAPLHPAHTRLGVHSSEENMSFKLMVRRIVMALVLGGYSVLGVGMSREKIESLMHAMNQSNVELSISDSEREPGGVAGDPSEDGHSLHQSDWRGAHYPPRSCLKSV
jgi:hypothetical protein